MDHAGSKFVGLTVVYNRKERYIDISMPDYVPKLLHRFAHRNIKPTDSPILYTPPVYGAQAQLVATADTSSLLTDAEILENQQIVGCGLWYSRMIGSTTLTAINIIATEQSEHRSSIQPKIDRYLGHLMQHPNVTVRFHASDMQYRVFGDVSHNSVSRGRSRAGGYGWFGWKSDPLRLNGSVFTMSSVLDVVTSSACEGEYGAAYMVARHTVWIRAIARALGHPQDPTHLYCDNTCAVGLAGDTLKTAKTKAIDLRFHWLRDRVRQGQFHIIWVPTEDNLADFFTKALPVHQHVQRAKQMVISAPLVRKTHRVARSAAYRRARSACVQPRPHERFTK